MSKQPPGPIWSIVIYSIVVSTAIALLWDNVETFWPDAWLLTNMAIAAAIFVIGFLFFGGRFVKPRWKAYGKGVGYLALSYFLLLWLGNWAWPWLIVHQGIGWVLHLVICRRHGIKWLSVEPRDKYVALMEKWG